MVDTHSYGRSSPRPLKLQQSFEMAAEAERIDAKVATLRTVIDSDKMVDGEYPVFAKRASGPYVWDLDGNRYLDLLLAYGTIVLGHADSTVDDAVVAELRAGFATGMIKPVQYALAEELVDVVPNAEMVCFLKTGSDATAAAVRLARAFTGRDRVLRWGYNGWHDWCAQRPEGVPRSSRDLVSIFSYNDPDSIRTELERRPNDYACLVMMPFELEEPNADFLPEIRRLCDSYGVLLVLDEMRTGFRLALGGAQEYYDIRADLATFSKAMANGYAISALTGRRDVLSTLSSVHISSTFYSNSDCMAAALATIGKLKTEPVLNHIARLGRRLQRALREQAELEGVPAEVLGVPSMPFLRMAYGSEELNTLAQQVFFKTTIRSKILLHPNHHWYLCGAMSDRDLDAVIEATALAFREVANEIAAHG